MPFSGLDPSMLIGFVCRDEAEWIDLRRRASELPSKTSRQRGPGRMTTTCSKIPRIPRLRAITASWSERNASRTTGSIDPPVQQQEARTRSG
ncbi:hypothetical protein C8R44DRAFT_332379 [Mycena epipterygia]|nr:hypothetical protein C8R44DRAFT_332379 [Mycena epipterygia]